MHHHSVIAIIYNTLHAGVNGHRGITNNIYTIMVYALLMDLEMTNAISCVELTMH